MDFVSTKKDGQFQSVWFDGPIYGTAQIINLLEGLKFGWSRPKLVYETSIAYRRGIQYLLRTCASEGEWGGSVSEAALAMYALKYVGQNKKFNFERTAQCILACQTEKGSFQPVYQGIYAKGWNYEEPISTALTVIRALDWYVSQWETKR